MLTEAVKGIAMSVTVTLVDGLVLARSAFHSSVNYRSVVILGTAEPVPVAEKLHALKTISDHIIPGRWDSLRPVKPQELDQTAVLRMEIIRSFREGAHRPAVGRRGGLWLADLGGHAGFRAAFHDCEARSAPCITNPCPGARAAPIGVLKSNDEVNDR